MLSQLHCLKAYNTFHLAVSAQRIVTVATPEALVEAWCESKKRQQPVLLLGEGSNVLFLEDFKGTVIINRIKGITVEEHSDAWHLHVGAGENWHELVSYTLNHHMAGLENLALIPGCVGSAPIQNIGAYGVELQQICDYVDVLNLISGETLRLKGKACHFGYRDSIFKHQYQHNHAIIAVGIVLRKAWVPAITYGDLASFDKDTVSPQQIFDAVCQMRKSKLPDPGIYGNAGSFFKNPLVSSVSAACLAERYPHAPIYTQANGSVKLAAGWLIDQAGLKGYCIGGAAVHRQQALVLINKHQATANDIVALAREVRRRVGEKFDVWLEPEVRFIGSKGEKNAVEVIS